MKDTEWNKLYWKITNDHIEEKLCDFGDSLDDDITLEDSEKLNEEEGFYANIHLYGMEYQEDAVTKLLYYNVKKHDEISKTNDVQEANKVRKSFSNFAISKEDSIKIAKLHFNAIKKILDNEMDNNSV
uniref:Cytosolic protein n=1 Tax=Meloidogyne hapla TaxID=6305 RepID=A0A1I8B6S0_MELHA